MDRAEWEHWNEQGAGPVLALPWALPIGFTLDSFVSCAVVYRFTGSRSYQASVVDHKMSRINSLSAVMSFWLAWCLGGQIQVSYQLPLAGD